MPKFIEFEEAGGGPPVHINPEHVVEARPGPKGGTTLQLVDGRSVEVAGHCGDVARRLQSLPTAPGPQVGGK
jgi:hypothetical protein